MYNREYYLLPNLVQQAFLVLAVATVPALLLSPAGSVVRPTRARTRMPGDYKLHAEGRMTRELRLDIFCQLRALITETLFSRSDQGEPGTRARLDENRRL
ncbi:hypothetical protein LZ30DRAFT_706171 [Colletotrichum cereale]|nr:hypothetical protein LZ30DRAFT_706171 [Colletotrichum cereale]